MCDLVRNETMQMGFIPPDQRPIGAMFQKVQFYIDMVLLCVFVLVFAFFKYGHPKRHHLHRMHPRSLSTVVLVHLGTAFASITGSYFWSHDLYVGVPCYVQIIASTNAIAFLLMPVLLRLYSFYCEDRLVRVLLTGSKPEDEVTEASSLQETASSRRLCCCSPRKLYWGREENLQERLLRWRTRTSRSALLVLLLCFLAPYFISSMVFVGIQHGVQCYGCSLTKAGKYVILVEAVAAISLVARVVYLVRRQQDSFGVLGEIRMALAFGAVPALVMYALQVGVGTLGEFSFYMLLEWFLMVFCYLQSVHPCVLAMRQYHHTAHAQRLYQMTLADFERLVVKPTGPYHEAFCKHLEMEHSIESVSFLRAVDFFTSSYFDVSQRTSQSRARKIVATYVGDNAAVPCNLSSKVVDELLLLSTSAEPKFDMFTPAVEELCMMLYRDAFKRFLATKPFLDIFLSQTANAVVVEGNL